MSISPDELTVGHVLDTVASTFHVDRNDVKVSLNNADFFGHDQEAMLIAEWGLVTGDLIYVASNAQEEEPMDQANPTISCVSSENSVQAQERPVIPIQPLSLPDACHRMMNDLNPQTPLQCLALAVYTVFLDEPSYNALPDHPSLPENLTNIGSVARLSMSHCYQLEQDQVDTVTITLVESGQFASAFGQVIFPNGDTDSYTATIPICEHITFNQEERQFQYANETELVIRIRDQLLMKSRQEIHEYYGLTPLGIQRLPVELQMNLLSNLDERSMCRLECTCSFYRALGRQGKIWKELFLKDFPKDYKVIVEAAKDESNRNWKLTYRQAYEERKRMELARQRLINLSTPYGNIIPWTPNIPHDDHIRPPPPGMIGGPADLRPPLDFLGPHFW